MTAGVSPGSSYPRGLAGCASARRGRPPGTLGTLAARSSFRPTRQVRLEMINEPSRAGAGLGGEAKFAAYLGVGDGGAGHGGTAAGGDAGGGATCKLAAATSVMSNCRLCRLVLSARLRNNAPSAVE